MNKDEFVLPTKAQKVFHYQYGHRLLGHAKTCPWCKDYTMTYEAMELAYRIPVTLFNAKKFKSKVLYHRLNWDWVCSTECREAMEKRWRAALIPQDTLAKKILETPELERIEFKSGDDYRTMVLKLCRMKPEMNLRTEVVETSTIRTIIHLTN